MVVESKEQVKLLEDSLVTQEAESNSALGLLNDQLESLTIQASESDAALEMLNERLKAECAAKAEVLQ